MTPQSNSESEHMSGDSSDARDETDELLDGRDLRETAPSGPIEIDDDVIPSTDRPLPLSALTQTKNQRDLLDYFLSVQLPEEGVSKTKMAEQSGVSANGIRRHIDVFLDFDIVELTTSEDAHFTRYTTTDNEVHDALVRANNVLAAHYNSNNEDGSWHT